MTHGKHHRWNLANPISVHSLRTVYGIIPDGHGREWRRKNNQLCRSSIAATDLLKREGWEA